MHERTILCCSSSVLKFYTTNYRKFSAELFRKSAVIFPDSAEISELTTLLQCIAFFNGDGWGVMMMMMMKEHATWRHDVWLSVNENGTVIKVNKSYHFGKPKFRYTVDMARFLVVSCNSSSLICILCWFVYNLYNGGGWYIIYIDNFSC